MGCLVICTVVSLTVVAGLLWLAATGLRAEAERVDEQVRSAHCQLFELSRRAYVAMLEEARRQHGRPR